MIAKYTNFEKRVKMKFLFKNLVNLLNTNKIIILERNYGQKVE